jgi:hypothetical protein
VTVAERVSELNTVFRRLVNGRGPRVGRLTLCVTAETRGQITEMAKSWQATQASVAAEVLEAAMREAWSAFLAARGPAKPYTIAEILACGCEPEIQHCAHCDGRRAANAAYDRGKQLGG